MLHENGKINWYLRLLHQNNLIFVGFYYFFTEIDKLIVGRRWITPLKQRNLTNVKNLIARHLYGGCVSAKFRLYFGWFGQIFRRKTRRNLKRNTIDNHLISR